MGCKGVVISKENSRIVNLSLSQDLKKVMPTDYREEALQGLKTGAPWIPLQKYFDQQNALNFLNLNFSKEDVCTF